MKFSKGDFVKATTEAEPVYGSVEDMTDDGTITTPDGAKATGTIDDPAYSVHNYLQEADDNTHPIDQRTAHNESELSAWSYTEKAKLEIRLTSQKPKGMVEYKTSPIAMQQISDRTVTGIASVFGNIDDGDDITHPGAFAKTLKEGSARVRHLWQHDARSPPTARIVELREVSRDELPDDVRRIYPDAKGGLLVSREYLDTPRGNEILQGIRAGAITEMSFGFNVVKKDMSSVDGKQVRNLRENRLFETSDVMWGMNPATRAKKGALPYLETKRAALDTPWDADAETRAASVDDLKAMCVWGDPENEEAKSAYLLPHHSAADGHPLIWNGVKSAMYALMFGAAAVPAGERRAVYEHLAAHYAEFAKDAPDFNFVELASTMQAARSLVAAGVDFKTGRMLSAQNMTTLKQVVDGLLSGVQQLETMLSAAEPPPDDVVTGKALTDRQSMIRRIDILSRLGVQ